MADIALAADGTPGPVSRSYWIVEGRLAAGAYPDPRPDCDRIGPLLDAGFDLFINLTEDHPGGGDRHLSRYDGRASERAAVVRRFPVADMGIPTEPLMERILDDIDKGLEDGRRIYVHCWAGLGRTGVVVGCWLVRHGHASPENVETILRKLRAGDRESGRRASPQTPAQFRMMQAWPQRPSKAKLPTRQERFRGCLLGLAAGDALGTTLEFRAPGTFDPIDDMAGGGPFRLQPGQWTDDTSMALCLATSLVECGEFDVRDQMKRYLRWYRDGYFSSTGRCFDIGNTTVAALESFERTGDPLSGSTDTFSAGNGSLMRLAPVAMFLADDPALAAARAANSSRTTHGAEEAVDACRYFAILLVRALNGVPKERILCGGDAGMALSPAIAEIAAGSFERREPPEIVGSGYAVRSLEAALWAFHRSTDFRSGALLVVNLGDDADTTGAIYGQIAGAHYGVRSIPESWRHKLSMRKEIEALADRLLASA